MPVGSFEAFDKVACCGVPDADALVEGTGCNILGIGGDGNGGDAILDAEGQDILSCFDVPKTDCAITRTRGNGTTIAGEVERVDILLVACKGVANASGSNVPNL